ncbi:hypothetical protein FEM48_Zijuj01G0214600 [Ziziphus jujuba var. spinosa]|uniref:Bulb-type lectin domain-containing protein n=1 Tax=Ziziphus jujuba var. spinosa TaxID=714518 RepID=A0A978W3N4_ZIZJJ|nr:hypothetical protein FEM48_Zijuj01G0214600 [Ziziphus jujuba var. spinosa]
MDNICFAFIGIHLLFSFFKFSTAVDAITQAQFISDGRGLTSKDGNFELGFFSPANSSSRFLGIWNRKIPLRTVSWIANVHKPINDSSGILMINGSANAVLLSQNTTVVWSSSSSKQSENPILQLLNSGNLVLRDGKDGNSGIFLWQSFDCPIGTVGLSARRVSLSASADVCDSYGLCGAYGVCTINELQVCKCLKGFKPVSPEKWKERDYTQGCERNKPLKCQENTGFIKYVGLKLPDNKNGWVSQGTKNGVKVKIVVIIVAVVFTVSGLLLAAYYIRKNRKMSKVSKDGNFELGFFSPGSSQNRYMGIWYKDIPVKTIIRLANRQNPINVSSGVRDDKDENSEKYLWQSFDYPFDTLLPSFLFSPRASSIVGSTTSSCTVA